MPTFLFVRPPQPPTYDTYLRRHEREVEQRRGAGRLRCGQALHEPDESHGEERDNYGATQRSTSQTTVSERSGTTAARPKLLFDHTTNHPGHLPTARSTKTSNSEEKDNYGATNFSVEPQPPPAQDTYPRRAEAQRVAMARSWATAMPTFLFVGPQPPPTQDTYLRRDEREDEQRRAAGQLRCDQATYEPDESHSEKRDNYGATNGFCYCRP